MKMNNWKRHGSLPVTKVLIAISAIIFCHVAMMGQVGAAYPDKPIHFIVGFDPGGISDVSARVVAAKLSEKIGQPVIVENRTGFDGVIAAGYLAHSQPDGYNIGWITLGHTVTPLFNKLDYDPIKSFAPIMITGYSAEILAINPVIPAKDLKEFIAYARANPGKIFWASSGPNGNDALASQVLINEAGIKVMPVPYRSGAAAVTSLVSGETQVMLTTVSRAAGLVRDGKVRALVTTTGARSPNLPDVPTALETGYVPKFAEATRYGSWVGVLAPAGTPKEIVTWLNQEIGQIVTSPEVSKSLDSSGLLSAPSTSDQFVKILGEEVAQWADVYKTLPRAESK